MSKKVSRRDFARASVAAGAVGAAVAALPESLLGNETTPPAAGGVAKSAGVAVAKRRKISMPPEVGYGGANDWGDGRDLLLSHTLTPAGQAPPVYPGGWKEGTTIPVEYYTDEKHYLHDERFLADHFWFMVDHHSRIPKPGDFFLVPFGRGESVIVLRNKAGEVKAYHNICRHRGSRLCQSESERPTEASPSAKPTDPAISVLQLAHEGNTPLFRCPYHAWTYDLDGKLVSFPKGMPDGFDPAQHGLHPAPVNIVGGFIWVSFAHGEAPEFDPWVNSWRATAERYRMQDLKIATRVKAPTHANWKLVIENFRECYHCYPAHTKSYSVVHQIYGDPNAETPAIRQRIDDELTRHGHPPRRGGGQGMAGGGAPYMRGGDNPIGQPEAGNRGQNLQGSHLKLGYLTGTLDGKPVAPLLPTQKEYTHFSQRAVSGFSTSWMMAYDDHVAVVRFAPRDVALTDAEIFWLVHPDAKEGKDYDVKRLQALWGNTYREDRWICENQQFGIMSNRYNYRAAQPYAQQEGGPASFIQWYMREVAAHSGERATAAL
jgi:phenylpropionate dioxygenase-like ring-hydroxylating dioxygenase large terminal subunit